MLTKERQIPQTEVALQKHRHTPALEKPKNMTTTETR
jgi:hypothetical protein